jgi:DNA-directed RNA polymerase alpha subunit
MLNDKQPIEEIEWSVRAYNLLKNMGINEIGQLSIFNIRSKKKIKALIKGTLVGQRSFREIRLAYKRAKRANGK